MKIESNSDREPVGSNVQRDTLAAEGFLLAELVRKQEESWKSGAPESIEKLIEKFSEQAQSPANAEVVLELICTEVYLREHVGQFPTLEEYKLRFPRFAAALSIQWQVDRLLSDSETTKNAPVNDVTVAEASTRVSTPKYIGKFEIQGVVGVGNSAIVYRAWDPQLRRTVALKRLRSGTEADVEELARLRSEAEAIALIKHPNIVQIFDVGDDNGLHYLTMEFCEGGPLSKRLGGHPLPPKLVAEFICKVAKGVTVAHANHIIHRDLKPANILLESASRLSPKVADFGLAKRLDIDQALTATGNVLGTPAYMSPEQAFGNSKDVGPTSDVYSLGAILYECLTGRPPFRGVTVADTLDQVRNLEPVPVRRLEPKVPLDLETITHKCLQKDANRRYQSMSELAEDLTRFLALQPIRARRENWYQTGWRWMRRYPLVASLMATTALLLLTIAIGSLVFTDSLLEALEKRRIAEIEAKKGQADALVGRAHGIRQSRSPGQRFEALSSIRKAIDIGNAIKLPREWFESIRDEAIAAMLLPDAYVESFTDEEKEVQFADFSDDHLLYAAAFATGDISLRRMSDNIEIASLARVGKRTGVIFVGNDRLLQGADPSGEFELWDVAADPPARLWHFDSGFQRCIVDHSKNVVAVYGNNETKIVELQSGVILNRMQTDRNIPISFHPNQELVLFTNLDMPLTEIRNWRTGELVEKLDFGQRHSDSTIYGADWSPDGTRLAMVTTSGTLLYLEFDPIRQSYKIVREDASQKYTLGGGPTLRFNASGAKLLTTGWNAKATLLNVNSGSALFSSEAVSTTYYSLNPRVDPQSSLFGLVKHAHTPLKHGWMKIDYADERATIIPFESMNAIPAAFDPTGRFVVMRVGQDMVFADVATNRVILKVTLRGMNTALIAFDDNGIVISANNGCLHWPYQFGGTSHSELILGIPRRLQIPAGQSYVASSGDGKTIAGAFWADGGAADYSGFWLKTADEPAARRLSRPDNGSNCSVSPDGKWVAFQFQHDAKSYVYNAQTLNLEIDFKEFSRASFDGSSSKIVVAGQVLDTTSWKPLAKFEESSPSHISLDGRTLVSCKGTNEVVLTCVDTGKTFAKIGSDTVEFERISAMGDLLLTRSNSGIELTDLKIIRRKLLEMGLPWDGPNYDSVVPPTPIKHVQLDPRLKSIDNSIDLYRLIDSIAVSDAEGDLDDGEKAFAAAMVHVQSRDWELAIDCINRACKSLPRAVTPRQWRAYIMAAQDRWTEAIDNADFVLERWESPELRLQRAEWLYRAGDYKRSIADCNRVETISSFWIKQAHGLRSLSHRALGNVQAADEDQTYFMDKTETHSVSLKSSALWRVNHDISLRQPLLASLFVEKLKVITSDFDAETRYAIAQVAYRNGCFQQSLDALGENLTDESNSYHPHALALASMCNVKLGNAEEAQKFFDRLDAWQPMEELDFFTQRDIALLRNEAGQLLKGR